MIHLHTNRRIYLKETYIARNSRLLSYLPKPRIYHLDKLHTTQQVANKNVITANYFYPSSFLFSGGPRKCHLKDEEIYDRSFPLIGDSSIPASCRTWQRKLVERNQWPWFILRPGSNVSKQCTIQSSEYDICISFSKQC